RNEKNIGKPKKLNKLRLIRLVTGQLPIFYLIYYLVINHDVLKHVSFQSGFVLCMILVNTAICNYFFTKEIRKEKVKENLTSNILFSQLIFIVIFITLGITCFYRFFFVLKI
ncbi:hypothetical protein, partial [Streptococcus uberis]|uniref:hypothetical protein n=1 Tax=Streptococcus uberis TaxID=1349 RepID=UPI0022B8C561